VGRIIIAAFYPRGVRPDPTVDGGESMVGYSLLMVFLLSLGI
jgi:hypothetical protein